ncbi:MAG: hypothetical protein A2843_00755 [Candidatus Wildermuthbacteria bacterium RIFCSPHIGHO2_01_FULL_48_27b]|uniref:Cytidyltransferase-like domain-containing protein n=1 Tax=Candidatus Wildermuthbacteria bacterium RIFCSPHIGHO2_01_FULL_48_27b TaxID=1802447 RepID=A0A1G2QXT9_9BACT|nr:MAG: hypothetical protein A2843_00755 [Candidatus Wildermuthbacteria bacterium RIFCSPHIGHO2_01_FULL_48_27b]
MKKPIVVYTYGVFDLLHVGHVQLLREAKALGDKLIVGVFTDAVAEGFKRRPIIVQEQRVEMLSALGFVDEVISQDELPPDTNLRKYKPNILAKGPGANWEEGKTPPGAEVMAELGGKVIFLKYHDGISTSQIIKKCKECDL